MTLNAGVDLADKLTYNKEMTLKSTWMTET